MREPAAPATTRQPAEVTGERWLQPVRGFALAVFVAMPVLGFLAPHRLGRVFWTVLLASLPLLIVLAGYHRWRRICPLAWLSQLPALLGHPGERRASPWLQAHYYSLTFAIFFVSLWLRLVATNGHGQTLAGFLLLLSFAAFICGAIYTGKTWCNYVCPVLFVEKIYTEPHGLRPTPNSQCAKCTACKPACPDINQENGYWKEILSKPKRFVYFAFPGLVLAFYLYFYLQSGTWEYYFGGRWTNEPQVPSTAFLPGHSAATAGFYFLPSWPRAAAAFLTLALGAALSFLLFSLVERSLGGRLRQRNEELDEAGVRHLMFTAAAFTAFVTFYSFAGAPTIRLIPGAPHLVQILVVATATLFLVRRFKRRQQAYAEETLARQIIRRWEWADMEPPKDLHEAFLIHTIRSRTHAGGYARLLEIYKDAVREAVASGFVSRAEVQRLESLRNQLQISQADHERIMADLDEEERARISDPALQVSAEKRLQLETYSRALQGYLERMSRAASAPEESFIRHLRQEYGITAEEHAALLRQLLGKGETVAPHVAGALEAIEGALRTLRLLAAAPSSAGDFLAEALSRRCSHAADGLLLAFGRDPEKKEDRALRDQLISGDAAVRSAAAQTLGEGVSAAVAARLREAWEIAARETGARTTLADAVRPHLASADPYVRVAAMYLLGERAAVDEETLKAMVHDEHDVVSETAICLLMRAHQLESREQTGLVTVERMIALRSVPLFASLAPQDLASLARASLELGFKYGQPLCVEGEPGDEVFILLSGEVRVLHADGSEERMTARENSGGFIEELSVLDSAPRAATVLAGVGGARVLCLKGKAFREVLRTNPSVVSSVIHALAARLRGARATSTESSRPQARVS
ncbi:MAG TPA: cyclic nucleotide-binding domain-containing protein [Terriglobales bacterium]|nr:cyclic nucleotide-binding domain-containing protein [Terriglobales bacterium]